MPQIGQKNYIYRQFGSKHDLACQVLIVGGGNRSGWWIQFPLNHPIAFWVKIRLIKILQKLISRHFDSSTRTLNHREISMYYQCILYVILATIDTQKVLKFKYAGLESHKNHYACLPRMSQISNVRSRKSQNRGGGWKEIGKA